MLVSSDVGLRWRALGIAYDLKRRDLGQVLTHFKIPAACAEIEMVELEEDLHRTSCGSDYPTATIG